MRTLERLRMRAVHHKAHLSGVTVLAHVHEIQQEVDTVVAFLDSLAEKLTDVADDFEVLGFHAHARDMRETVGEIRDESLLLLMRRDTVTSCDGCKYVEWSDSEDPDEDEIYHLMKCNLHGFTTDWPQGCPDYEVEDEDDE